jgi:hypothetical protein
MDACWNERLRQRRLMFDISTYGLLTTHSEPAGTVNSSTEFHRRRNFRWSIQITNRPNVTVHWHCRYYPPERRTSCKKVDLQCSDICLTRGDFGGSMVDKFFLKRTVTMKNIIQHIKTRRLPTNPSDYLIPQHIIAHNAFLFCICPRRRCCFGIINLSHPH